MTRDDIIRMAREAAKEAPRGTTEGATAMRDINLEGLSDKQLRLFAVRCARRVQHLMRDPRSIAALDVAERHAKTEAADKELAEAAAAAWEAARAAETAANAAWDAGDARAAWAAWDAARAAETAANAAWAAGDTTWDAAWAAELAEQQKILDEIRQEQPR